jgi:hypothetical protein
MKKLLGVVFSLTLLAASLAQAVEMRPVITLDIAKKNGCGL